MPTRVRVELEIEIERDQPIRGVVRDAGGAHRFAGWLELNSAIESVCEAAGEGGSSAAPSARATLRRPEAGRG